MTTSRTIVLITYGTRGDVEPFIALGIGLRGAGHAVRLMAPAAYSSLAQDNKIDFTPLAGDPDQLALSFSDQAGLSWVGMISSMVKHVMPIAETVARTIEKEIHQADLLVHSFLLTHGGSTLAQMRGIPEVSAQLFPVFMPTGDFPAIGLPDLPLGRIYRRATHILSSTVFSAGGGILYRKIRASARDLPSLGEWPFNPQKKPPTPILFGYSPHVLPQPTDWPENAHTTGYWRLPRLETWRPSEELLRFIDAGSPPLYFGIGSMRSQRLEEIVQMAIEAAKITGQRMILNVPRDSLDKTEFDANIYLGENIPHDWLFPQTSFIIHHGGAGTTGAAIRAGVPNCAIPFSGDQAFWAKRIHRLGLGPAAPTAQRLTSGCLAEIIEQALVNPTFRHKAQALGKEVHSEDGVGAAVKIIQQILGC